MGSGSCRGMGWDWNGWPKSIGRLFSIDECANACDEMSGCTAFEVDGYMNCNLFGHSDVSPSISTDAQCWKKIKGILYLYDSYIVWLI